MLHRTTPPSGAVITTAEAKTHIRQAITDATEDAYIDSLVAAITREAEIYTNRGFLTQTHTLYLDWFPACPFIEIPIAPITAITSVKYYDANGTLQTLSGGSYQVDIISEPARISLAPNALTVWPTTQLDRMNSVEIACTVGYGNAAAVPDGIKHAIKLAVGSLYGNREDEITGATATKLDRTCERMLYPYRLFRFP